MSHELPGDDLQCLCVGAHDELLLALDGFGVVAEGLGQLHFDRTASCHNLSKNNPATVKDVRRRQISVPSVKSLGASTLRLECYAETAVRQGDDVFRRRQSNL